MAAPTYPGVYIQELTSPVHPITGVATSIAAFVGYTARGIDNRAQQIFSFSDYQRLYGGLASNSEVGYSVQQFFLNGGSQAYVVRTPRSGALDASVAFGNNLANSVAVTALSSGAWANGQLLADVDFSGLSAVVSGTVDVTAAGAVTGDGTSFTSSLSLGQYLVFAADPNHTPCQITAITSATSLTVTPGVGPYTGTTAIVMSDPTAFNLTVTNLVDGTIESFPNVSLNNNLSSYIGNVVNDLDNGSSLVSVAVAAPGLTAIPPPATGLVGATFTMLGFLSTLEQATITGINLTSGSASVASSTNAFTSALVGQVLVFASDATNTHYQVATFTSSSSITLTSDFGGSNATNTTAATVAPVAIAGINLTNGSASVASSTNAFTSALVGRLVVFASDPTNTFYQVASFASAGSITLTANYTGSSATGTTATPVINTALANLGFFLGVSEPSPTPAPLPIAVKVIAAGSSIPLTFSGLAILLQTAINSALAAQMPSASVQCTVAGVGVNQSIRINALIPQAPDAVLNITSGSPTYADIAGPLQLLAASSPSQNVSHYALGTGNTWGSVTASTAGSDGVGLPATTDLIGDPGSNTGIYALTLPDVFFNLLCIPEATRAIPGNPSAQDPTVDPNSIFSAAIALCDTKRAMLLIDCPPFVNTVASAVDWKTSGLTVVDPNGAAFFPRVRLPDPLNNYQLRTFAPCGVVAGLYARTDTTRGVWKAPAGTEATLSGVQALVYKLGDTEQGVLNPIGLNCFRNFPVYGSVLWGARTLVGADAMANQWKYVPVRRVALFLEASLYQGTQWVVFEPNDEPLWSAIRLNIGSFMQNLFIQGYFQGQTPDQAYFVKCDSETTTQTDIDNGIVNIVVGFAPLMPAEFVIIQIQQLSGQTSN